MTIPPAVTYVCVPVLVGFSGLFSGLTLGLLGLDPKGLAIVAKAGSTSDAAAAKKIAPIRARGNLLLCTLLLGNTAVNAALSVLMADLTSGLVGIIVSTVVIVIFGEIVPQSCCSRYALQVGAFAVPIVTVLMVLMWPIAFPLSFILDKALGEELGTIHSRAELSELIRMEQQAGILEAGAARVVHGALHLWDTPIKDLMTPIEDAFTLDADCKLDFEQKAEIHKRGFSRVPVINTQKKLVEGILLARDLAIVNKKDCVPVGTFTQEFKRKLVQVGPDLTVGLAMQVFSNFRTHLVVVVKEMPKIQEKQPKGPKHHVARVAKKCYKSMATCDGIPVENVLGVLSFDDCASAVFSATLEEKDQGEQEPSPSDPPMKHLPSKFNRYLPSWGVVMPHICEAQTDASDGTGSESLSDCEVSALAEHLRSSHPKVPWPATPTLEQALVKAPVSCLRRAGPANAPPEGTDCLFTLGEPLQRCLITLCGKVRVTCGKDHLRFHRGTFGVLGIAALTNPSDVADFSAYLASAEVRCLQLKQDDIFPGGVPPPVVVADPGPPQQAIEASKTASNGTSGPETQQMETE